VCGVHPVGARGNVKGAWPRRERDVAAVSRGRRAWQGHGGVVAWHGEAGTRLSLSAWVCTHARGSWLIRAVALPCRARGTGIPGPRHDIAGEGNGGCGLVGRRGRLLHKSGTRPDGRGGPKTWLKRAHRHCRQHEGQKGESGGGAHR
jgi:hypothetical protein